MVKKGGVSYPFRLFWIDFCHNLIKKALPDDHSSLILRITAPEGSATSIPIASCRNIKISSDSIPA
jgi:hypothetical protein